ncbi:MAG TPA: ATP-binding cassette domain-containing protein, partial [Bdellovibrionota bacterium]|nr:ATP-binding cassette domain-containing protein [Bdellovibrionota bacterium]
GEFDLHGRPHRPRGPAHSIRSGIGLLTADRKRTGLVLGLSLRENITLSSLGRHSPGGILSRRREREAAGRHVSTLRIRAFGQEQEVRELSGGNQQKVALAKCLEPAPRILLLNEPTRGVDVGAKTEIHALIRELAGQGMAILVLSTELPELLSLSDRVVVMHRGRVSATLSGTEATSERVIAAAMGSHA